MQNERQNRFLRSFHPATKRTDFLDGIATEKSPLKNARPSVPNNWTHFSNMYTMPIKLYFFSIFTQTKEIPWYFPSEIHAMFLEPFYCILFIL